MSRNLRQRTKIFIDAEKVLFPFLSQLAILYAAILSLFKDNLNEVFSKKFFSAYSFGF